MTTHPLLFEFISIAARCGRLHAIHAILAVDKESALIRNHLGNVALHNAVKIGSFAAVSALCGQNALSARIQVSIFRRLFRIQSSVVHLFSYNIFLS